MIFPVAIKFKEILEGKITHENEQTILLFIRKRIEEKAADNIVTEKNAISYKGSTSGWNTALFRGLSGTFSLANKDGKCYLIYEIRMRQLFIVTSIMAIAMGVFVQIWWVSLVMFGWLCGMNWIIYIARHSGLIADIASDIDEMFFGDEDAVDTEDIES